MIARVLRKFLEHQAAGGIVLIVTMLVAVTVKNSSLGEFYEHFRHLPLGLKLGTTNLVAPIEFWVNDGLMAIFFLLVGLEIKREFLEGELSTWGQRILPTLAAVGGMLCPALIYLIINYSQPDTIKGWAIPSATDIAFSVGVISLVSSRIPISLKIFLLALAIIDDLGAIIIIALVYSSNLNLAFLGLAVAASLILSLMSRRGVASLVPYLLVGLVLWIFVLKSGIHATIAGVILGCSIPLRSRSTASESPLKRLMHLLHPWVAYFILPLFAFINSGLDLSFISWNAITEPVALGIAAGLFFGKQIGVMVTVFLAVKLRLSKLPLGASWFQLYGVALLTGIGFTMSLFIGMLAFPSNELISETQLGVIIGSIASAVCGYVVLRISTNNIVTKENTNPRSEREVAA